MQSLYDEALKSILLSILRILLRSLIRAALMLDNQIKTKPGSTLPGVYHPDEDLPGTLSLITDIGVLGDKHTK